MEREFGVRRDGEVKVASDESFTPWDEDTRYNVVTEFLKSGNMREVERVTKVPYSTIRLWRKSKWWDEYTRAVRGEKDVVLSHRVEAMLGKAMDAMEERVTSGDVVFNPRTGEYERVPVKAQVLNAITANLSKQRIELANQPTQSQMHDKDATAAKLQELASAFANFVTNKRKALTIDSDTDVQDVVPEPN